MTNEQNQTTITPEASPASINWGRLLAWGGLLVLMVILGLGLIRAQRGAVSVGEEAPAFVLTTYEGQQIDSKDWAGKVIVLNFWASWCKPCEQEAADLEAAWRNYQSNGDVIFLGVAYTDTPTESAKYLAKFDITYPNGGDLGTRISQAYRIRGVPETYIIGRDGLIAHAQIGPFMSQQQIEAIIEMALGK
jgi:cytochrome c biogenesis protein CcmG/thiol:disulfide interchange protein DsbE